MPSSLAARFPALQSRDFRNLWIGQIVSAAGSQMQMTALGWQVYELTDNPLYLGLMGLVRLGPIFIFSLLGGALADARDRRGLLLVTQSTLAAVALALAALTASGRASVAGIFLLTALGASAIAFDNPARQSLIPALVPREHLTNAFALNSTGFQVATIGGPMLAGVVIQRYGIAPAYLFNAVSFLAVIAALLSLSYRHNAAEGAAGVVNLESLKEGLRFVWTTPILVGTILLDFFATLFSSINPLLPVFARDILKVGADGFGVLSAAPACGSLVAGATMTLLPPIRHPGRTMLLAVAAFGLATVGFGVSNAFGLSVLFLAGTGAADTVSTILRQTIRQTITPDRLRGRMVSVNMIFFMGGPQLGALQAGLVASLFSAPVAVVAGAIGCLFSTALVARLAPALRHYRVAPDPAPED